MSGLMPSAVCEERSSYGQVSQLRRAYFAQAADSAMRYQVGFEQLIAHLEHARAGQPQIVVGAIRYVDDLVQAVACIQDTDLAWWDLVEHHERALVRACRQWQEPTDAIVYVRRLLSSLRREDGSVTSLRNFDGTCTLRRWLGDRIVGGLNRSGFPRHPVPPTAPRPKTIRGLSTETHAPLAMLGRHAGT